MFHPLQEHRFHCLVSSQSENEVGIQILPAVVLEHTEHPVEQAGSFCFELPCIQERMIRCDHTERDLEPVALERVTF